MDLASSSSGATAILFPAMQQVCSLFHPSSFLRGATGDLFFPLSALLFIGHPSVKVNSIKEGMRGKKPIRGERWDEVWWTGLRREGGDDANQICTPYKKTTDEMALLLWQHTFCSGILGVTLLKQVLQGFEPSLIPNHLTDWLGMYAVFPASVPAAH